MPTAEDVLADSQSTDSADQINHCIISEDLRTIMLPEDQVLLGVTGDEKVRRVWFDMPRECDGLDLSEFVVYIKYRNANNVTGRYRSEDKVVGEDLITFSWIVSRNATIAPGKVEFSVCLREYDTDNITVMHEFNTKPIEGRVDEGLSVEEDVVIQYRDEINELLENIDITPETLGISLASESAVRALITS